ncbi:MULTISPECIES: DUF305 domain-containing protein [unclassified Spirosoma]|mgnify:FL=1|uniref:DUF305 domain-containing protein n=1 Tax=Spirosoma linguale (strain ATCC 33905 / DSM 74 / LMG 10896 / Claus 1) TaxID=504472 RepID=D2QVL8_SPILD|nr:MULTISPECIES: DUF305 domain-containing protein [unclassified Spirosoma]ADB42850.1 protein of unknown function DUF305 [Spirosoma linguale DSM 74]MBN8820563.1 DUF305 domain-containing protein [Spirosoma sp.]OJW77702.1 MAG: DUF305 domain-containing protein [Spirosoma sp. 48-14]
MKNELFTVVSLSAVLLLSQPALAQQSASNGMMKAMQSGMNQMMSMKMTGDPDHDFAMMLKMHHQSAVDMSEMEIRQGKNAQVKALAGKIKTANQAEIKELTQFISSHKPQTASSKLGQDAMKIMHSGKHSMNGNMDHDYASMMAQHHQQGIDMANAFLKEGKTEKMKMMARKVIQNQTKEVAELKKMEAQIVSR